MLKHVKLTVLVVIKRTVGNIKKRRMLSCTSVVITHRRIFQSSSNDHSVSLSSSAVNRPQIPNKDHSQSLLCYTVAYVGKLFMRGFSAYAKLK
jgi:hypothetical protein